MKADTVKLSFTDGFKGELVSPSAKINIGQNENGIQPYHMLFGALGSCFYATFLSVATKMRLTFGDANIEVNGNKRDATPATLEWVEIKITISNPSDEEKLRKACELGAKYCSIHETISKVAEMKLVVEFIHS